MHRRVIGSVGAAAALATLALGVAPARTAAATATPTYYLSLGDSLAQGVQPDSTGANQVTTNGYPDQLYASVASRFANLQLAKLGCPGETSTSMIHGATQPTGDPFPPSPCTYTAGSQLNAALAFIRHHKVSFVTIDIGANNVDGCIVGGVIDQTCLVTGITALANDLPVILNAIHTLRPHLPIKGMYYYDPFLAAYLTGPAGVTLAQQSVAQTTYLNQVIMGPIYRQFGARIVDVESTFQTTNFTIDPSTGLPINVELICQWTYMCAPSPVGPNIHATTAGYAAIAGTFAMVVRPNHL